MRSRAGICSGKPTDENSAGLHRVFSVSGIPIGNDLRPLLFLCRPERVAAIDALSDLYKRLLGPQWNQLSEIVRSAHYADTVLRGNFCVTSGEGRLARILARVLRLPTAFDATPVELQITRDGRGEQWLRTFGARHLRTLQYEAPGGLLAERFGVLELRFRLSVIDNSLRYCQESVFFCIGRQRVSLPRWISPTVSATETALANPPRTRVAVTVSLPWIGLLIAYDGELEIPSRST